MQINGGAGSRASPDSRTSPGAELREDIPLKASAGWGAGNRCLVGGPRLILVAFAALSAAITLALLTQIYYGDYEVVPHGSVSSSAAACSRAGTDALKAGGRALDAAAAAALCLAALAPHRTSLDATGSMLYWEYRDSRTKEPTLYEWGGGGDNTSMSGAAGRAPHLVVALAVLHAQHGALTWARVLQPAIQLARYGFEVSEGLAQAGGGVAGTNATAPELATYLQSLLRNSSAELSRAWGGLGALRVSSPARVAAGGWRAYGPPALLHTLPLAVPQPGDTEDDAQIRVVQALQAGPAPAGGVSTALAAVDSRDTYVALATGLSVPFGSGAVTPGGWVRDEPSAPLDLAPALLLDDHVCGTRYVIGAESSAALAQVAGALAGGGGPGAVERARLALVAAPASRAPAPAAAAPAALLALEAARGVATLPASLAAAAAANASLPYAAVNLVLQRADVLTSHADSRGGGLASRF